MVQFDEKTDKPIDKRLELLFDSGTFAELGTYTKRKGTSELSAVTCGYGSVGGKLVFAFIQSSERTKGALDTRHAEKICSLYSLAVKNGAPVIGVFDSAGAIVYDGATALSAYGRVMKCVSDASGIIPQIAIVDGVCGGSSAVIASMFDFCITVKGASRLFVNPPFNSGDIPCDASSYEAQGIEEAYSFARTLVSVLPENNAVSSFIDNADSPARAIDLDIEGCDTDTLLASLSDNGGFVALYKDYCKNVRVGFASFGGIVSGVVASAGDGALDTRSAKAASRLVAFCDAFGIPVVTLVNSVGFDKGETCSAYSRELARLAFAYTSSECAKVTVIVGKALGGAFTLLGSKSVGADMVMAVPTAEISLLPTDTSVAFVWNDRVSDESREALEAEWREQYSAPENALESGDIDDIIAPTELRARICSALSMLSAKAEGPVGRRHISSPL